MQETDNRLDSSEWRSANIHQTSSQIHVRTVQMKSDSEKPAENQSKRRYLNTAT